jgi:hypothetical protein
LPPSSSYAPVLFWGPFSEKGERIFDKNEEIWGKNLYLSIIADMLSSISGIVHQRGVFVKLTDEAFSAWCQQHQIPPETERYLQLIRSSPPARRVRGRTSNVSGRYPSVKMGMSIQFESHRVELWAIYAMERDDNVLEDSSSTVS